MKWVLPIVAAIGSWYWFNRPAPVASVPDDMPDQLPTTLDTIMIDAQTVTDTAVQAITDQVSPAPVAAAADPAQNRKAFLDMIAYSEGTSGPMGYQTLFGGGVFNDTRDHPRQVFSFTNSAGQQLKTTAAGRYQFLARTWDALKSQLQLPDFGPDSQDRAALELVRQRGALPDVDAGRIQTAVTKCAPIWASLPGAGYNQPERKLNTLLAAYTGAGGTLQA